LFHLGKKISLIKLLALFSNFTLHIIKMVMTNEKYQMCNIGGSSQG
jgi:hypothetical protein